VHERIATGAWARFFSDHRFSFRRGRSPNAGPAFWPRPIPSQNQARPHRAEPDIPSPFVAMGGRFPGAPDVDTFWAAGDGSDKARTWIFGISEDELDLPQAPGSGAGAAVFSTAPNGFDAPISDLTRARADRLDPQPPRPAENCVREGAGRRRATRTPTALLDGSGIFAGREPRIRYS